MSLAVHTGNGIDPNWGRWAKERSVYNPDFPSFMTPTQIDEYRDAARVQSFHIKREIAAIAARRQEAAAQKDRHKLEQRQHAARRTHSEICAMLIEWIDA